MIRIILLLIFVLIFSNQAIAKEGGSNGDEDRREFRREERTEDGEFRQRIEVRIRDIQTVGKAEGAVVPEEKVEIGENEFEITGTITSITGNRIMVAEEEIVIDPDEVLEFEQKGVLAQGNTVKVEGIIKDNTKFATEITVFGTDLGNIRVKVENKEGGNDKLIEVKAKGPLDQIKAFFQQIGSFLNNLVS